MRRSQRLQNSRTSKRDAITIALAMVFILLASFASHNGESATDASEERTEAQEVAMARLEPRRPRPSREQRRATPSSLIPRLSGKI